MASKNIIADLNKGEKLNGDNYNIWHLKIQFVLEEQEVLETINVEMEEPQVVEGNNNCGNPRGRLDPFGWIRTETQGTLWRPPSPARPGWRVRTETPGTLG